MTHRIRRKLLTKTTVALAMVAMANPALADILPGPHIHPHGLESLATLAVLVLTILFIAGIKVVRQRTRTSTKDDATLD